ncbi:hypothetical protein D3C76_1063750 [compost metagenome]
MQLNQRLGLDSVIKIYGGDPEELFRGLPKVDLTLRNADKQAGSVSPISGGSLPACFLH